MANRLNLLSGSPGLQAARRAVLTCDDPVIHAYAGLEYAVLMPWIGGRTWWEYLQNSSGTIGDGKRAFRVAARLLEVIAGFEERGIAHSDLCAANVIVDFDRCNVELIDLEDMYLPGVPEPAFRTTGQVGYQHPSGEITWNPAGDRFASAVLAAEVLLSATLELHLHDGLFCGSNTLDARQRFMLADDLLGRWYPAFAEMFRQSWVSTTLSRSPPIADLHAALMNDGPVEGASLGNDNKPVEVRPDDAEGRSDPRRVFVSYSHRDSRFRNELGKHLTSLKREGLVEDWHDQDIAAGAEWEKGIFEQLLSAHIIVLLISADFLSSEYCYGQEMQTALKRHKEGSARVIPVILRDVDWHNSPFAGLQALPVKNAQVFPLNRWSSRDAAWLTVVLAIRKVVSI